MILTLFVLFLSLALLTIGAELLVLGASRLASIFGVSHLVIGLTIVAFGTSSPELVVSVRGALTNHSDLVVGNCVGSNIFNILFIIGACAIITPLIVVKQLVRLDVPIMIGSHLLFLFTSIDGTISKKDSFIFLTCFLFYYLFIIYKSIRDDPFGDKNNKDSPQNAKPNYTILTILYETGLVISGLILCVLGADWLVDSAVTLARILGVSELIIGLTIVAAGTSLPEVATSIVATIRGQRDIAIGNVVGSCIFNILGIIGIAGLIAPNEITVASSVIRFDLPIAIAASVACLPIFFYNYRISRWDGFLFLFYYVAYITYLVLDAHGHDALPLFNTVMLWFVIPLSILTFGLIAYRTR